MPTHHTLPPDILTPKEIRKLWSRIERRGPDECWEWQSSRMPEKVIRPGVVTGGYGRMYVSAIRDQAYTHRLVFVTYYQRPQPTGMVVMHTCDNPPCCNPAHLRLGTYADNARDRENKGRRSSPPSGRPARKIIEHRRDEFEFLYNRNMPLKQMARHFSTQLSTVRSVVEMLHLPPRTRFSNKTSQYVGVSYKPNRSKPWMARISINGRDKFLGRFVSEMEAARVYDEACIRLDRPAVNFPAATQD